MNELLLGLPQLLVGETPDLLDEEDFDFDTEMVQSLRFWDDDPDEEFWREDGWTEQTFDSPMFNEDSVEKAEELAEVAPGSPASFRAFETATTPQRWFQQDNGRIPENRLMEVPGLGRYQPAAGKALKAMKRAARKDGINLSGGGYRSYAEQEALQYKEALGIPVAEPGHSNHGWGTAADIDVTDPDVFRWLQHNAGRFGWENPEWAQNGVEPWHWEFNGEFESRAAEPRNKVNRKEYIPPKRKPQNIDPAEVETEDVTPISTIPGVMMTLLGEPQGHTVTTRERGSSVPTGRVPSFVPKQYRSLFLRASRKYDIPVKLLALVAQKESGFNPTAQSSAGALGMMQIMPQYHQLKDYFDPRENVMYGASYLSGLIRQYKGNIRNALAHYNAGGGLTAGFGYADDILNTWRG